MPIAQRVNYNITHIKQDQNMSCWHAAATMLLRASGFMHAVRTATNVSSASRYVVNKGLMPLDIEKFANEVGLSIFQVQYSKYRDWRGILEVYGPLWIPTSINGGHIVVVSGIYSNGSLIVNDPARDAPIYVDQNALNNKVHWNMPMIYNSALANHRNLQEPLNYVTNRY